MDRNDANSLRLNLPSLAGWGAPGGGAGTDAGVSDDADVDDRNDANSLLLNVLSRCAGARSGYAAAFAKVRCSSNAICPGLRRLAREAGLAGVGADEAVLRA